ncbi:MAG TPA: peroxidase family protein [Phenylobacterium sp.]
MDDATNHAAMSNLAPASGSDAAQAAAQPLPKPRVAAHGLDNRGLEAAASLGVGYGRFGRMFAFTGGGLPEACLLDIATAMIKVDAGVPIDVAEAVDENPLVPAGYTYFGQFVDHDITLDTTSLKQKAVDVAAMIDFRTPALDLDCVYGRGPDDQPYMYESDGVHLRLGDALTAPGVAGATRNRHDVLRMTSAGAIPVPIGKGPNPAILGDKRNDENRIVCQIQAGMIAFHNKVAEDQGLIAEFGGDFSDAGSRFRTAANIVRWHYQWLVLNDYLNRVLEPTIIDEILGNGPEPSLPNYAKPEAKYAYMPVEFSGAAFRFGHSMVRPSYALNEKVGADKDKTATENEDTTQQPARIMIFTDDADPKRNLNGFGFKLPDDWGIDWSFFFDGPSRTGQPAKFKLPQPSYRMDAQLVNPLRDLPEFRSGAEVALRNLAFRNLLRGDGNLRLPFGEQVAHALGIEPLPPEVLWGTGSQKLFKPGPGGATVQRDAAELATILGDELEEFEGTDERRAVVRDKWIKTNSLLKGHTPLWYYILREAEYFGDTRAGTKDETPFFGGQHLGPVGSRIVGETFVGLLWNDPTSYLRMRPKFKPHAKIAGGNPAGFTVGALFKYALG